MNQRPNRNQFPVQMQPKGQMQQQMNSDNNPYPICPPGMFFPRMVQPMPMGWVPIVPNMTPPGQSSQSCCSIHTGSGNSVYTGSHSQIIGDNRGVICGSHLTITGSNYGCITGSHNQIQGDNYGQIVGSHNVVYGKDYGSITGTHNIVKSENHSQNNDIQYQGQRRIQ